MKLAGKQTPHVWHMLWSSEWQRWQWG